MNQHDQFFHNQQSEISPIFEETSMSPVLPTATRREYIHVGSSATSVSLMVAVGNTELIPPTSQQEIFLKQKR
jgi:hypothetical protein